MPAVYLAYLLEVTARFGVAREALLAGSGIDEAALSHPHARIRSAAFLVAVERAIVLTGEPGLGFYHGLSLKLSAHGSPGLLAMTSPTLGAALLVAQRFLVLRSAQFIWQTRREGDAAVVALVCHVPQGALHRFLIESALIGLVQMGRALVGHPIPLLGVTFAYPEPAYFARFSHMLSGPVRFGEPQTSLRFPWAVLDEAVVTADPLLSGHLLQECERDLQRVDARDRFLFELRHALRQADAAPPSLSQMARHRHLSVRTLKRHLAEHGTTYRQLLEEVQRERATTLLAQSALSVAEIAERLGYTDPASFHRAFRRWLGVSPGAYRAGAGGRPSRGPSPNALLGVHAVSSTRSA